MLTIRKYDALKRLVACDWPTRENGRRRIIVALASVRLLGAATIMRFALGECVSHSVELDDLRIRNSLLLSGTESTFTKLFHFL